MRLARTFCFLHVRASFSPLALARPLSNHPAAAAVSRRPPTALQPPSAPPPHTRACLAGPRDRQLAAASTVSGLHLLTRVLSDIASPGILPAASFPDAEAHPALHYHDLRWKPDEPLLYAIGDSSNIDVFAAVV